MRAAISDELMNMITEKIYIDLEINVLHNRLEKAVKANNEELIPKLNKIIYTVTRERKHINSLLRENNIKVFEPEYFYDSPDADPIFIDYRYYQKVKGGYKEGSQRFWKDAIKYKLKLRVQRHFN
ncbi:hypothetical protein LCM23_13235 [Cytobacillus kochii]|uniref:hypothetical protein n=1 Tax=Cytobacillus kochii TaxID=859143 RepID=UPI001CD24BDD|nr:hypothetical protein [Cytobacillus kochii]MCA1027059.1 hypothetical protein [Cytobacillus kochii]